MRRRLASSRLGLGAYSAMQLAEELYLRGFLSYPRTESSGFPPGFDFLTPLEELAAHPAWSETASRLVELGAGRGPLCKGYRDHPRSPEIDSRLGAGRGPLCAGARGKDAGDHPPITPARAAGSDEVGGGVRWRMYEMAPHRTSAPPPVELPWWAVLARAGWPRVGGADLPRRPRVRVRVRVMSRWRRPSSPPYP